MFHVSFDSGAIASAGVTAGVSTIKKGAVHLAANSPLDIGEETSKQNRKKRERPPTASRPYYASR